MGKLRQTSSPGIAAPAMLRIFVLAACLAGGVSYTVPTSRQVAARRATMLFPRALSPTASITGLDKGEPEVDIMEMIRQDRIKEAERNILFLLPVAFLSSYAFYMALISL